MIKCLSRVHPFLHYLCNCHSTAVRLELSEAHGGYARCFSCSSTSLGVRCWHERCLIPLYVWGHEVACQLNEEACE